MREPGDELVAFLYADPAGLCRGGAVPRRRLAGALAAGVAPGAVTADDGPVNASSDNFRVIVAGHAGHAAYPHVTRDPGFETAPGSPRVPLHHPQFLPARGTVATVARAMACAYVAAT